MVRGARVDWLEERYGKSILEILAPYIRFKTPATLVAKELGVSVHTLRYWMRKIKRGTKKGGEK